MTAKVRNQAYRSERKQKKRRDRRTNSKVLLIPYIIVNLVLGASLSVVTVAFTIYALVTSAASSMEDPVMFAFWICLSVTAAVWCAYFGSGILACTLKEPWGRIFAILSYISSFFAFFVITVAALLVCLGALVMWMLPIIGLLYYIPLPFEILLFITCYVALLASLILMAIRRRYKRLEARYDARMMLEALSESDPTDVLQKNENIDGNVENDVLSAENMQVEN